MVVPKGIVLGEPRGGYGTGTLLVREPGIRILAHRTPGILIPGSNKIYVIKHRFIYTIGYLTWSTYLAYNQAEAGPRQF
jgi:hypothetical protein